MTPQQELKQAEAVLAASEAVIAAIAATQGTPLQWLLKRFHQEAAQSLLALADADPEDAKAIRNLQNDVARFRDTVRFLAEAIAAGDDARFRLDQQDRESFAELIESGLEAL